MTARDTSTSGDASSASVWGKTLQGGAWLFGLRFTERLLGVARLAVLARLLSPHDFGLMGIALMVMAFVRQFSETGFRDALVQKQGDIGSYLGTAWIVILARDLVLAGLMVGTAPLLSSFFDAPDATMVVQVAALSWLLSGLRNIGLVYLQKDLAFNRYSIYHLAVIATELVVSITAGILLRNVWALVFGLLASNFIALVFSWIVAPRPARIDFNPTYARELFRFGRWILGWQMLTFLSLQLDKLVIGRVVGVNALGLYQIAYNVSTLTSKEMILVVSRATLPAYAKLQENIENVKEAYLKVVQAASLVSVPVATGTVLLAGGLTRYVLGEQWVPIVSTLQILALWSVLQGFSQMTFPLFAGLGRPDVSTKTLAARMTLFVALVYPFTRWWGMEGTAIAIVVSSALVDPVVCFLALRQVRGSLLELLNTLAPAMMGAAAMVVSVLFVGGSLLQEESLVRFITLVFTGGLAYLAGVAIWSVVFRWDPRALLDLRSANETEPT